MSSKKQQMIEAAKKRGFGVLMGFEPSIVRIGLDVHETEVRLFKSLIFTKWIYDEEADELYYYQVLIYQKNKWATWRNKNQ